ncbi:MAG: transposase, partial [Gammaproteobacteria bacterium]|nr:transposase [Gammaproteobacteria bacterium]
SRRVIGKAEYLSGGPNPRFIVTSISAQHYDGEVLYEHVYCARGDMENRIKEQQLSLFADRTSAATMRANQLRLYFSSLAYCLLQALRRLALAGTRYAHAQCDTLRLRLLKLGARVRITVRNIWVSLSLSMPK